MQLKVKSPRLWCCWNCPGEGNIEATEFPSWLSYYHCISEGKVVLKQAFLLHGLLCWMYAYGKALDVTKWKGSVAKRINKRKNVQLPNMSRASGKVIKSSYFTDYWAMFLPGCLGWAEVRWNENMTSSTQIPNRIIALPLKLITVKKRLTCYFIEYSVLFLSTPKDFR